MLKKTLLAVGLVSSSILLPGCGTPKLGVTEVCFVSPEVMHCFYPDGTSKDKTFSEADKYTAFSVENAQKIQNYVDRCLKAGIRP